MGSNTDLEEVMGKLQAPFSSEDIEWRVSHAGTNQNGKWAMALAYVTNRAIQSRLDEVFGPGGWTNSFEDFKSGIICTISCKIGNEWISKQDGAETTDFEAFKGGLSSAMKRAAVQWGIGRYLYKLEAVFVKVADNKFDGAIKIKDKKNNVEGYWLPPQLPDWALPNNEKKDTRNIQTPKNSNESKTENQDRQFNTNKKLEFNKNRCISTIHEFLNSTGLANRKDLIIPLFKRINPNLQENDYIKALKNSSKQELKLYYNCLQPVHGLTLITEKFGISIDETLNYVKMLLPQIKVENLFNCFMHLTKDHVRQIKVFIEEDLNNGNLIKSA